MKKRLLSLLLCVVLLVWLIPAGAVKAFAAENDLASTGDYDYTDPDNPYMATDLNGLKEVFEKERPTGTTVYIKLAKDIFTSVHTGTLNLLTTNGADVVLDLAGYTMGITSNYSILMIEGVNGTVTIEDSKRYDSAKKQWVDGRLEFECQTHLLGYSQTYVLAGNIIVKGGVIKNNNHSAKRQDCGYYGRNLEMYGGTLDADYPIYLCSLGDLKKCAVHDGTLRVRRDVAISSPFADFIVPNRHPVIERCFIENASDNEKVSAVNLALMRDFTEKYTADDAFKLWYTIVSPETYAFINGVRQPQGSHGVLYNGDGALVGPLFRESYVLTPLDTVSTLRFTVDEPQAGNSIIYHASTPSRAPYQVKDYDDDSKGWRNGVQWGYYDYNDSVLAHVYNSEGTVYFRPGVRYGIWIRVSLKDPYLARFADPEELSATINGNAAKVTENLDGTLTVSCDFNVSNVLSYVQVMVPDPVVGEAIPYAASVPTYAQEQYEVPALSSGTYRNGVLWSKNGAPLNPASAGSFEYGNKYTAYILVKPTPDYVFPEPDELTAVINNRVAERVVNYGEYGYAFVYTFDLTNLVGSVELTIPEPRAGAQLEWTASAPEGADYTVADNSSGMMANGVMWYQGTTAITPGRAVRFEVFETYKVVIRIKALNGRHFSGEDMPALVNGHTAAVSGVYSETDYLVSYTFTAKNLIDRLDITIPTPIKGGPITYKSTLPDECGFQLSDYTFDSDDEYWRNGMSWWENGVRLQANKSYFFTAGREYDVYIAVNPTWEPQFKYADTSDMTVTVNGNPATIERATFCYLISYTFTIPAETTGYILGDVDGDGEVTIIDATAIQRHLASIPTFAYHENAADTDGDGEVTILDATFIQRWLANLPANNKIGQPI